MLRRALDGNPPWAASGIGLTHDLLTDMVHGHGGAGDLLSLMTSKVGTGDACILAEVAAYRARIPSKTPVRIWSHDKLLAAYSYS